jgi:acylaminoacyl-peptidase
VPVDVRISPDGTRVAFAVKASTKRRDRYRTAIWLAPADGSGPARQLTLGATSDASPRWSPDGRSLAFLSDRGAVLEVGGAGDRVAPALPPTEGKVQAWVLPLDGGEGRQVSRLPRDVTDLAWSPDSRSLCLVSSAERATDPTPDPRPDEPPEPDIRLIDRLGYMVNDQGFIHDRPLNLWLLDVESEEARRLTGGRAKDENPAWSPDGRRIAFVSGRHRDADLDWRQDLYTVEAAGGAVTLITGGEGERLFTVPTWSPDGRWLASVGHRYPAGAGSRADVWRFRARERDEGENLTGHGDLMVGSAMNSDLFAAGDAQLQWSSDGRWIVFTAPFEGRYELWRVEVGRRRVERITDGRHYIFHNDLAAGADDKGPLRLAAARVTAVEPPNVISMDLPRTRLGSREPDIRLLSDLMGEDWADIDLVAPQERWHEVDGRRIQGWLLPAAGSHRGRPAPLVVEIHGGPQTLYGWSLFWEWQCLAGAGISVYACNPRGSQGYGQDFCAANLRDWGPGPMRDVMGGVDALISDGLVDGDRLGLTGGSYGGYLTTWMVGHTDRFKAAVTCRSVSDLTSQMLSGDIAGPQFGKLEFEAQPWEDPELYRFHSPLSYAREIRTPLLIQHAENDLRTPITQAEELFTVLRSLRRPVRLMRVPEESHELTRSGTPVRRVENLRIIRDWFVHYLVRGKRGLPPIPRRKTGSVPAA